MPRRSPRKVDPALDLERHLRAFEQLPQPWDSEAVFGAERPLEVELGTGKGLFLSAAASAERLIGRRERAVRMLVAAIPLRSATSRSREE